MTVTPRPEFVDSLLRPGVLADVDAPVELIETHISWVLLAGDHAYKIKKPVNLGFLDFSTLEKRKAACFEELRLNRRLAPQLYEAVVTISGDAAAPRLDGAGPALDYAVRMRRFPQSQLLDRLQRQGRLSAALIDTATVEVAHFHRALGPAPEHSLYGDPQRIWAPAEQNFRQIDATPLAASQHERLARLRAWSVREHTTKHEHFLRRRAQGHIRECHGDLHLGNMVALEDQVVLFDCIEFNPELRWIDTLSEIAFLVMDLDDRGEPALAHRCLNRYLEETGDYRDLAVLPFYLVYRALVRAKVNAIRSNQDGIANEERERALAEGAQYLTLASRYTDPDLPQLYLTHGVSGSGKTTLTQTLVERLGAIRVRSDVERKRLAGLAAHARSGSAPGGGLYDAGMTARTYAELRQLAEAILGAGRSVVVDATFLRQAQRAPFLELAQRLSVPVTLLCFEAPEAVLETRIGERQRAGADASEATPEVLHQQLTQREPLTPFEAGIAVALDTRDPECVSRWLASVSR